MPIPLETRRLSLGVHPRVIFNEPAGPGSKLTVPMKAIVILPILGLYFYSASQSDQISASKVKLKRPFHRVPIPVPPPFIVILWILLKCTEGTAMPILLLLDNKIVIFLV